MQCPFCGSTKHRVIDSREAADAIRRRRQCEACEERFTTYERAQAVPSIPDEELFNAQSQAMRELVKHGDSVVIGPKGRGGPVTFKVTAHPGTVLSFICAFHPWMQGRFLVK